jgi:hypothetical protein
MGFEQSHEPTAKSALNGPIVRVPEAAPGRGGGDAGPRVLGEGGPGGRGGTA